MLARSAASLYAKSVFYSDFNDIDVYIEDTLEGSRKIYVSILNRVFDGAVKVSQVFPLGGRRAVTERCKADQGDRPRPAIYIIDGDYDCITGDSDGDLRRLYKLKRYCIENYLVDLDAVVDILDEEDIELEVVDIEKKLDLAAWRERLASSLGDLVLFLAAGKKLNCSLPSVNFDLREIEGEFPDQVDAEKVAGLIAKYRSAVDDRQGEGAMDGLVNVFRPKVPADASFRGLSAKAVFMPLLKKRLQRKGGYAPMDHKKFKLRLARRCDIAEFSDLRSVVA
ncbi:hypothetical protein CH75_17445 [Dyella jiangningensis]|nr:hypothetical protein CH75_17445 [Dyella jiangningensis]